MSIFNDDDLIEIIRLKTQDKLSSRKIAKIYGCGKSTINYFLKRETYISFWESHDDKPVAGGAVVDKLITKKRIDEFTDKKVYIFTSAQNNTHVNDKFLKSLEVCAEHRNAKIIVGTFTYNKTGFQNATKDDGDLWYDPKIRDYILDESIMICDDLVYSGELNILPTAANPASGLTSYTGNNSQIIPHAKMQLHSIANSKHEPTKIIYTTACVTQSNYIGKKAGQRAKFHHIYGALLVEVDVDGTWFARQINAESETGVFYDLDVKYTPEGYTTGNRIFALNYGDIHTEQLDPIAGSVSFGVELDFNGFPVRSNICDNMLDDLKPEFSFYHDIFDMKTRNHHSRNDPLHKIKMVNGNTDLVVYSVKAVAELLKLTARSWCQSVVVNSNHDRALKKWLLECDWKNDPVNAKYMLSLQLALVTEIDNPDYDIFEAAVREHYNGGMKFLKLDECFKLKNIQFGNHGDNGANGARGSINSFRNTGEKGNYGHSHSANWIDGIIYAGVLGALNQGYNIGNSSWSHSNVITYQNGKRAVITIKGDKYRALCGGNVNDGTS